MKKWLCLVTLLFCGFSSFSQAQKGIYTPVNPSVYGSNNLRVRASMSLGIPEKDALILNTDDQSPQVFYYSVDSSIYGWSKQKGFFKVGSGGGSSSGGQVDINYGTVSQLRSLSTVTGKVYFSTDKYGIWTDIGLTDGQYEDDGAIYINTSNGHTLKKQYTGAVNAQWYAVNNGTTDVTNSIASAVQNGLVEFSQGTYLVGNLTIPEATTIRVLEGAKIKIKSGTTLTINGQIDAGNYQIFEFEDATANVTTTNPGTWNVDAGAKTKIHNAIKVDWFGATPDAVPPVNFSSNYNQVPTGTNSSDGFRRAFKFATAASIKFESVHGKPIKVTVEATPNGAYRVVGNNILGVQDATVAGVGIDFEGNGCSIFHEVQDSLDALIGNGNKLHSPFYRNFSVDVYNSAGKTRFGRFFDTKNSDAFNAFVKPVFEQIRIGIFSVARGYDIIFRLQGTNMEDNGEVRNCSFNSFRLGFDCNNGEAVNWIFNKVGFYSATPNGAIARFYDGYSGNFTLNACEILVTQTGESIIKTTGTGSATSKFRVVNGRLETRNANAYTLFDMSYGTTEVEGLDASYGSDQNPQAGTRTAKLGRDAFIRFKDCTMPEEFDVYLDKPGTAGSAFMNALQFDNCNFYPHDHRGSAYPHLNFLNETGINFSTLKQALGYGYLLRRVIVDHPRVNNFNLSAPIEYGTYSSNSFKIQTSKIYNGKTLLADDAFPVLPYNIIITSIKLHLESVSNTVVDNVRFSLGSAGGGTWIALDSLPIPNNVPLNGIEMLPQGKQLLIPDLITTIGIAYRHGMTQLFTDDVKPEGWLTIEYRAIKSATDYGVNENFPALASSLNEMPSVYTGGNQIIEGEKVFKGFNPVSIDGNVLQYKNSALGLPGYATGILGDNTGDFTIFNSNTGIRSMTIDKITDNVKFWTRVSGASAINYNDFLTLGQFKDSISNFNKNTDTTIIYTGNYMTGTGQSTSPLNVDVSKIRVVGSGFFTGDGTTTQFTFAVNNVPGLNPNSRIFPSSKTPMGAVVEWVEASTESITIHFLTAPSAGAKTIDYIIIP